MTKSNITKSIPEYLSEMSDDEFLEALADYGDGWIYIHEAAKRLRSLKTTLELRQREVIELKKQRNHEFVEVGGR